MAEMEHKHALDTICSLDGGGVRGSLMASEWRSEGRLLREGEREREAEGEEEEKEEGNWKVGRVSAAPTAAQGFLSINTVSD